MKSKFLLSQVFLWTIVAMFAPECLIVASRASDSSLVQASAIPMATPPSDDHQKGEAILGKVSQFYSSLKSFSFELNTNTVVKLDSSSQPEVDIDATFAIALKRPNKLAIVELAGTPVLDMHCDGKNMIVYSSEAKKYVEAPAEADAVGLLLDPDFRNGYGCLRDGGIEAILSDKPVTWDKFTIAQQVQEVAYIGEDRIDGIAVDKLRILAPKFTEYIYVDRSTTDPWIRRVSLFDTGVAEHPMPSGAPRMISLSTTVNYKKTIANPNLSESKFKFIASKGVVSADSFAPDEPPSPLLGKPAADFNGELADGRTIKLSQFKGHKTVILDFWATWCGPCRMALPMVIQVAADYKKKGVVFYAVNLEEDQGKVQEFLKDNNVAMSVVLDRDLSITKRYDPSGLIPMTVIIDKKGIVRAVHTGYSPRVGRSLSRQLDHILGIRKK